MDIGAIGKSKGYKGKGYGNKGNAGKGQGRSQQRKVQEQKTDRWKAWTAAKDGSNNNTHKWPRKEQDKASRRARTPSTCHKCGLEGHYAKDCKVAVYNLNDTSTYQPDPTTQWWTDAGQAYATDWWREDHTGAAQQIAAAQQQGMQQPQRVIQQHPGQQGQSVSGLLIAMTAYTDSVGDVRQQNDIVDVMIDSGAATHVCPQWFAPRSQLHALPKGDEPQLRTVTNTQIKVHGYKYVIMKNNKRQPIVILHAPILSVTRLTEQGFNMQLNETPTITRKHGFETQLVQMTQLPQGATPTVKHTEQGQIGMIAPTITLTPTGPATQAGGGNADYW